MAQEVRLLREQLKKPTLEAAKVEDKEGNVAKEPQQRTNPTDLHVAVGAAAGKDGFAQKLLAPFHSKFLSAFKTVKEKVKEKFVESKSLILERTKGKDETKIDATEDMIDSNYDPIADAKKEEDVVEDLKGLNVQLIENAKKINNFKVNMEAKMGKIQSTVDELQDVVEFWRNMYDIKKENEELKPTENLVKHDSIFHLSPAPANLFSPSPRSRLPRNNTSSMNLEPG